jgi:hypothetical protein
MPPHSRQSCNMAAGRHCWDSPPSGASGATAQGVSAPARHQLRGQSRHAPHAPSSQCAAILRRVASPPGEGGRMPQSAASVVHGGQDHDLRPSLSLLARRPHRPPDQPASPRANADHQGGTISTNLIHSNALNPCGRAARARYSGLGPSPWPGRRRAILSLPTKGPGFRPRRET